MRLLPPEAFAVVFEPLRGKRIGRVRSIGNVGDQLIEAATDQLLAEYSIQWQWQDPSGPIGDVDELIFSGGGNMGTLWSNNYELRTKCLALGLPLTILPQSFSSPEDRPFKRVYVRERASLAYCPTGILAPDLALGLEYENRIRPQRKLGVFVRKDKESVVARPWFSPDPVRICRVVEDYLNLAARYKRIVTDRLHFAICGLICGRDVTLLPNSYHKNRSMYDTWLRQLGCKFASSVAEAVAPRQQAA